MTRDSFRNRHIKICSPPTRAPPVPEKKCASLMITSSVVLHTQPKPGLTKSETAAICSQNVATAKPVPTSTQGKGNSLKITTYVGVWWKNLSLNYLGFSVETFTQEIFQLQFWLCNNNSNSHWDEGHTGHTRSANRPGKAPFPSPVPLTALQPPACQPMPQMQVSLSHLFFRVLGAHEEKESTGLVSLMGWQSTWHTGVVVLVQERDKRAETCRWKGRGWRG